MSQLLKQSLVTLSNLNDKPILCAETFNYENDELNY